MTPCHSRYVLALACLALATSARAAAPEPDPQHTYRLYPGIVAYVNNPSGAGFDVAVDLRDWNVFAEGPREVLLKVYDPDGRSVVRQVIEDDGITSGAYQPAIGGWDHEMWYYAMCYGQGTVPMMRWSSFSEPKRLAAMAARTFKHSIAGGKKGVYRVLVVGERDHTATLRISPELKYAVAGDALWLHARADRLERSFVYVPKGTTGLHLGLAEFDLPVTRRFTITGPDGKKLFDGEATGGFRQASIAFDNAGAYDDKLLAVEVAGGAGDFMIHLGLARKDLRLYRGAGNVPALFASDEETARAVQGGAIYHDGEVFWHGFQVRLHDWLRSLKPEDLIVRGPDGKEIEATPSTKAYGWGARGLEYKGLASRKGFVPLNGAHEAPPICDTLMHSYPAHRDRGVLNVAIEDFARGLRQISVGDHPAPGGWNNNFGYMFATYGFHYWRPAWRILQQSDAPEEVKDIVRESMILCGDRLAFGRMIERVNGNAFAHIPMALRYCCEGTQDPIQKELFRTYFDRFATGGWGRGAGIGPSGDCQEHFGHDYHYGSYIVSSYAAVIADLDDSDFKRVRDGILNVYSHVFCPDANAFPWGSRTAHGIGGISGWGIPWHGSPGPDFTRSIKDANEWMVARRKNYYVVTYHGSLTPMWLNYYFASRLGYGGGLLCQVSVPGKRTVIASTQHESYGKGMEPWNWRKLHIHSIVGLMEDGRPLVAADSEHLDARLTGNVVESSGEVRDRPLRCRRKYTFADDAIACEVSLADTDLRQAYWNQGHPQTIKEAYEMIPFVGGDDTRVTAIDAGGKPIGPLTPEPANAKTIDISRGTCGVRIELPDVMPVQLGGSNTVMIRLVDQVTKAEKVSLAYRLIPYGVE